jgi:glycosyltransferase involved in cell wall biosynthesis
MYPPIKTSWYKTDSHQNKFITFINPVKVKGVEKVLKCAKHLPHRRFQLVETWPIPSEEYKKLIEQIHLLPNVALRKHTEDMKQIYENSSLLLMPSRWEEAFGRVIVEANINGIPVIASNVGGISEALGNGGKLLTRNASIQTWIEAIEELLTNKSLYENFSKKAYTNSNRKEFNQEYIMNGFLDIANKHINTFSYHDVF